MKPEDFIPGVTQPKHKSRCEYSRSLLAATSSCGASQAAWAEVQAKAFKLETLCSIIMCTLLLFHRCVQSSARPSIALI